MSKNEVVIVGAGLAGLCCARRLHQAGIPFVILEAADGVGGRVRTDVVDGFLLDRGFQVLLTAYPEVRAQLDFDALDLKPFLNGALIRRRGEFIRIADPWRVPGAFVPMAFSRIGTVADKFRLYRLRSRILNASIEELFSAEDISTLQFLQRLRFSKRMIESFFQPFFGGILLDPQLGASSRMMQFALQMLADGDVAVPAKGMGEIPRQLAAGLPPDSIHLGAQVVSRGPGAVVLGSGERVEGKAIVIATDGPEALRLLPLKTNMSSRSVTCLYFAAKEPPIEDPLLVLSGGSRGPVNNLAVMNLVAPEYAPAGENLISVTVLGMPARDEAALIHMVRRQLKRWFGLVADEWRHLRTYAIDHALPGVRPLEWQLPNAIEPGLYVCGDHRGTPSLQGAMESGRLAAETILTDWGVSPPSD
jgi:phytoene dehydrogenase-like protein